MARYAIGDIQGCYRELRELLQRCSFRSDCDELWFVGDLVNRGPESLAVLRFVRNLGENAVVVLGNHDLHLLAVAFSGTRELRPDDTLDDVLAAPDRDLLLQWLLARPLAHYDAAAGDLLIHAGLLPKWTTPQVLQLAQAVSVDLQHDPAEVFAAMYGNKPDRWDDALTGADRRRVVINALTRMRFCTLEGRLDVKLKGAPASAPAPWLPWFAVPQRASRDTRVVCGHWSTLGWHDAHNVLALDTGCVWGGALTAVRLDRESGDSVANREPATKPLPRWSVACSGAQHPRSD